MPMSSSVDRSGVMMLVSANAGHSAFTRTSLYAPAMARTNAPHSATAQFFINVVDNDFLNFSSPTPQGFGYAVFGKVVEGTDVVDQIKAVRTGSSGFHQDVPLEDVVIEKAVIVE